MHILSFYFVLEGEGEGTKDTSLKQLHFWQYIKFQGLCASSL